MTDDDAFPAGTGVLPLEEIISKPGLEFLTDIRDGRGPGVPIGATFSFGLSEVAPGTVAFTGHPKKRFYNPIGTVHGGWTSTLLDSCMACAVQTTLQPGEAYTSVEIKVNFVKAITDKTGPVRAEGKVTSRGRRIATAEGRLVDAKGTVLALGTTTCLIMAMERGPK